MISLTERAAEKIKSLQKQNSNKQTMLRFGVKGGGCSGFTYTIDFSEQKNETDQVFEYNDVKIVIDAKSFVFLAGTEIDYVETLTSSGFTFSNPNATRTCGCGSSFQA